MPWGRILDRKFQTMTMMAKQLNAAFTIDPIITFLRLSTFYATYNFIWHKIWLDTPKVSDSCRHVPYNCL